MTTVQRLAAWYSEHCDGEREHHHGIKIETCDNPGWWVSIDLIGTSLEAKSFSRIAVGVDENDFQTADRWLCCIVEDNRFHGAGDLSQFDEIVEVFLSWAGN